VLDAVATALDGGGQAGRRNDRMLEKPYRDAKIYDIGQGDAARAADHRDAPAVRVPARWLTPLRFR